MNATPQKEWATPGEVQPTQTHAAQGSAGKRRPIFADAKLTAQGQAHDAWRGHRVVTFMGQYDSHNSEELPHKLGNDYNTLTLAEVFEMEPACFDKGAGPAIIPSEYFAWDARTHDVQQKRGSFVALAADIDKGDPPLEAVWSAVRDFVGEGVASLVYSSSSAQADLKKWRVVIPLAQAASFEDWHDMQSAFFWFMQEQGLTLDWSLARAAQPVYLPNVPAARRGADGQPLFYERMVAGGRGLEPVDYVLADCLEDLRQRREEAEREAAPARETAQRRMLERKASGRGSVIDAFNREYDLATLMEAHGYTRGPRDTWRSPYQSSNTFATRCYGDHWVSLSESDAQAGLGRPSAKGHRFGDPFDLYCHFEYGGKTAPAVKEAAKLLGLDKGADRPAQACGVIIDLDAAQRAQDKRSRPTQADPLPDGQDRTGEAVEGADLAGFHILEMPDGIKATEFVVDGFLPNGVTVISGAPGAGKTTNLEPMAASVAHLSPAEWGFHPKRRRVVVWLSEHPEQVFDTMEAIMREGVTTSREEWAQWFKVVSTKRSSPEALADLITAANKRFSWANERGVWVRPLIVWDTAAATIDVDNENDNTVISKAISKAKEVLDEGALWVIHHTPKADKDADSVETMSARGGGAFEGDANCTAYLFTDKQTRRRVLGLGKIRFAPEFTEVHFDSARHTETIVDHFDGQELDKTVTAGIPSRGTKEGRQQEKKDTHQQAQMDAILQAAVEAAGRGDVCSGNDLIARVRESSGLAIGNDSRKPLLDKMRASGMLKEVEIPKDVHRQLKLNNRKTTAMLPSSADPERVFQMAMHGSVVPSESRNIDPISVKLEGGHP